MIENLEYYYKKESNIYIGYSKFIQNKKYKVENVHSLYDLKIRPDIISLCSSGILKKTTPSVVKKGIKDKGYHIFDEKIILIEIDNNNNSSIIGLVEDNYINKKFLKKNNIDFNNYNLEKDDINNIINFEEDNINNNNFIENNNYYNNTFNNIDNKINNKKKIKNNNIVINYSNYIDDIIINNNLNLDDNYDSIITNI